MLKKVFVCILLCVLVCVLSDKGSEQGEGDEKEEGGNGRKGHQGETEITATAEITRVENITQIVINNKSEFEWSENITEEPRKYVLERIEQDELRAIGADKKEAENNINKTEGMWKEADSENYGRKKMWEGKGSNKIKEGNVTTNTSIVEDKWEIVENLEKKEKNANGDKTIEEGRDNKSQEDDKERKRAEEMPEYKRIELSEEEIEAQKIAERLELEEMEAKRLEEIKEQEINKNEEMRNSDGRDEKREVKASEQISEMKNNTKTMHAEDMENKLKNNTNEAHKKDEKEENQEEAKKEKVIEFKEVKEWEESSTLHEKEAENLGKNDSDIKQEMAINQEVEEIEEKQIPYDRNLKSYTTISQKIEETEEKQRQFDLEFKQETTIIQRTEEIEENSERADGNLEHETTTYQETEETAVKQNQYNGEIKHETTAIQNTEEIEENHERSDGNLEQERTIIQETQKIEENQKKNIIKVKKEEAGKKENQVIMEGEYKSDEEVSTQKMLEGEKKIRQGEEREKKNNETNPSKSLEDEEYEELDYLDNHHENKTGNITNQETLLSDEDHRNNNVVPRTGDDVYNVHKKPTRSVRKSNGIETGAGMDYFESEPELNMTGWHLEMERLQRHEADIPVFRVVSGTRVQPGEVPYQVAFRKATARTGEGLYRTFCGGALMTTRRVVSAAHCFRKYNASVCNDTLRAGRTHRLIPEETLRSVFAVAGSVVNMDVFREDSPDGGQWRRLQSVSYPSSYEFPQDDICIAETVEPFEFNERVQPVYLARRHAEYRGLDCVASGYGSTSEDNQSKSEVLLRAPMSIEVDPVCERLHGRRMRDLLCTATQLPDVAKGDSGGPLVCYGAPEDSMSGRGVLVGVVSGKLRTRRGPSAFFTRVSSYREFLEADPEAAPVADAARLCTASTVLCLFSVLYGLLA